MTRRAFTLLELVAVLVLAGLLLAFSPIALDFLVAEKELESEVSRLGSSIELLKVQAVVDQAPYAMHIDTEKHRWAIQIPVEVEEQPAGGDADPIRYYVLEEEVPPDDLNWHDLPEGIQIELYEGRRRIEKGRYRVQYDPAGTVPPHTLVLESDNIKSLNEDERIRTIKVNFPGFVSYSPGRVIEKFKKTEAEIGR